LLPDGCARVFVLTAALMSCLDAVDLRPDDESFDLATIEQVRTDR
jgi:hypothetical protein